MKNKKGQGVSQVAMIIIGVVVLIIIIVIIAGPKLVEVASSIWS